MEGFTFGTSLCVQNVNVSELGRVYPALGNAHRCYTVSFPWSLLWIPALSLSSSSARETGEVPGASAGAVAIQFRTIDSIVSQFTLM